VSETIVRGSLEINCKELDEWRGWARARANGLDPVPSGAVAHPRGECLSSGAKVDRRHMAEADWWAGGPASARIPPNHLCILVTTHSKKLNTV